MLYHFRNNVLNTAQFALYDDGQKVEVEPQVLNLLQYLIENRDRVVSRGELLDRVFGRRIVTDNALTVRIGAARRAVGDDAGTQAVIATVQGGGYRFVAEVETRSQVSFRSASPPDAAGAPSETLLTPNSAARPSIAVLPLEVIGTGDDDDVIARGLAHDVTTRIARSRTMFVIARGTAFRFESGRSDIRDIGAKLGVRYVVQGAVQTSGRRIRVTVALASTETCEELQSWQYDRTLGDVLEIQEEIALEIVGVLESEVMRQEMQRSTLMSSSNLDAWSAYHRGLAHMYRFRIKECDSAERFFRRAIDLEPDVPRPYAGLSFVNYERAYLNVDGDRDNSLRRAFDFASQAISVDSLDPMAHWALSRAQFLSGDLDAARASVRLATELNPSYATAQYFLGWVSMQLGDHEFCLDRVGLAIRLSPYDPLIYGMQGITAMSLALLGHSGQAIVRAREALHHPDVHYQARAMGVAIFALAGETELARESLEIVLSVNPDYDADEFFSVYRFSEDDDVRRIREAFERIRRLV